MKSTNRDALVFAGAFCIVWGVLYYGRADILAAAGPVLISGPLRDEVKADSAAREEADCRANERYTAEAALKESLKDPGSYARISFEQHDLPDSEGMGIRNPVRLAINYRAKNGFGAYEVGQAVMIFNAKECRELRPVAL